MGAVQKTVAERPILEVDNLHITYGGGAHAMQAVKGVSLHVGRGEAYGLIGESGSGKTSIAFAALKYLKGGRVSDGAIRFKGSNLADIEGAELAALRGKAISIVYQDPMSALNPQLTVGEQIAETIRRHTDAGPAQARAATLDLFREVRLPDPERMLKRYPHQLSGGQQQRVVIAMALACRPELLIMDEPTTGLDVTTEAAVLELVSELRTRLGLSVLFISHNLAVVSKVCDRVGVLRHGVLVEEGGVDAVMCQPQEDYTRMLVAAAPRVPRTESELAQAPKLGQAGDVLLRAEGLRKTFRQQRGFLQPARDGVRALDDVTLDLRIGETLAVVGESGSGKSTLARVIAGIMPVDDGQLSFDDAALSLVVEQRNWKQRREVQIIFQNPDASLNPLHRIGQIIARPLHLYGLRRGQAAIHERVLELIEAVKLEPRMLGQYPWQLSGGQKQRVAVARAFAAEPRLIICDEPTSALDISVQARLLEQLRALQEASRTAYLFISHDLGVVSTIAHRVMVMQLGRVVETGTVQDIFLHPREAYTRALIAAVPSLAPPAFIQETRS